jgi:hypothetical protein
VGLLRANREVSLDQRVGELPLAAHELEAVLLEQCSAHAERTQLLPLADEPSDPLLQLLDAGPDVAVAEVEGPLVAGGRSCVSANTDYPSRAAPCPRKSSRSGWTAESSGASRVGSVEQGDAGHCHESALDEKRRRLVTVARCGTPFVAGNPWR